MQTRWKIDDIKYSDTDISSSISSYFLFMISSINKRWSYIQAWKKGNNNGQWPHTHIVNTIAHISGATPPTWISYCQSGLSNSRATKRINSIKKFENRAFCMWKLGWLKWSKYLRQNWLIDYWGYFYIVSEKTQNLSCTILNELWDSFLQSEL